MNALALTPTEEVPDEFRTRLTRRDGGRPSGQKRTRIRARGLATLAVAIAVPALAAPQGWNGIPQPNGGAMVRTIAPMGFERRGESFPGSAFYYLADAPGQAGSLAPDARWDSKDATPVGPVAKPLAARGSPIDTARALECMTMAIYYEAASELPAGQRAVAQVVLNRVAHPTYPSTVCGVVFQGSARSTGCQFTFTCDGSLTRRPERSAWQRARAIASAALDGEVYAPVGLATHYHTIQIHPYWADSLSKLGTIGAHVFYRWKGAAGQPSAFRSVYSGGEPGPSTLAMDRARSVETADPIALARAYEQSLAKQQGNMVTPGAAPTYSAQIAERGGDDLYRGDKLPAASAVKPEYADSGSWLKSRD